MHKSGNHRRASAAAWFQGNSELLHAGGDWLHTETKRQRIEHHKFPMKKYLTPALAVLAAVFLSPFAVSADKTKPVLLYSRYFNAKGEARYLPDGTYKNVLDQLRGHFDVRISEDPLTADQLRDVAVILIANPSAEAVGTNPPPHHCSPEDVRELNAYVRAGGGLIAMGNQEKHNLETTDFNKLLGTFGMKFESNYTDAKQLTLPAAVPIIGGLRWAYYTGNQIILDLSHEAKPRALVNNDLTQTLAGGTRDEAGTLLAVAEPGHGHVVLVTDAGWISNDALSGKGIEASRSRITITSKSFCALPSGRPASVSSWCRAAIVPRNSFSIFTRRCLVLSRVPSSKVARNENTRFRRAGKTSY